MHKKKYRYYMFCGILTSYYPPPQKKNAFILLCKVIYQYHLKNRESLLIVFQTKQYIYLDFIIINHPDYKDWNQITSALGSSHALRACLSMDFPPSTLPVLQGSVHRRIQDRIRYNKTPKISLA